MISLLTFIFLFSFAGRMHGMENNLVNGAEFIPAIQEQLQENVKNNRSLNISRKQVLNKFDALHENSDVPERLAKKIAQQEQEYADLLNCLAAGGQLTATTLLKHIADKTLDKEDTRNQIITAYNKSALSNVGRQSALYSLQKYTGKSYHLVDHNKHPYLDSLLESVGYTTTQTALRFYCKSEAAKKVAKEWHLDEIPEWAQEEAQEGALSVGSHVVWVSLKALIDYVS